MIEPQNHNISGLSQFHRGPVTIIGEEVARVLADVQAQKSNLRRHRIKMRLLRLQLDVMEAQWRGE